MQNIAVVYYSGYGHTKLVAEKVAQGAHADLISIDNEEISLSRSGKNWTQPIPLSSVLPPIWAVRHGNSRNLLMPVQSVVLRKWQDKVFGVSPTTPA